MSNKTKKDLSNLTSEDRLAIRDRAAETINAARKALNLDELTEAQIKRKVGGGGFTPSSEFTLTGEVRVVPIEGTTNGFNAVVTTTGECISLKALIPQNPAGYSTEGNFVDEVEPKEKNPEKVGATFDTSECSGDLKDKTPLEIYKSNLVKLNHGTKSEIELFGLISEGVVSCKDMKLTYCGKVCRQTIAKKDYPFGGKTVQKGAKRTMTLAIWSVE